MAEPFGRGSRRRRAREALVAGSDFAIQWSLATMGVEGEFTRRIGLTPLRMLYRRLRFGDRRHLAQPMLELLDIRLLEHICAMLPAARDVAALGACCHHLKRACATRPSRGRRSRRSRALSAFAHRVAGRSTCHRPARVERARRCS